MKISIAVVAVLFHILVVSDGVSGRALKGGKGKGATSADIMSKKEKSNKGKGVTTSDDEVEVEHPEPCTPPEAVVPAPTGCLTKEGVDGIMAAFEGAVVAISNVSSLPKETLSFAVASCCLLGDDGCLVWVY
jgi:hypothetical protein